MIQYVIAGLVLGGIYAIASAGLVVTYRAAGILNFGFGAMAYLIARFYYFLHSQLGWGIVPAALVAVVLAGPLLGTGLYFGLFRLLRLSSPLGKVVVTIGVSVCIPPLAAVLFGTEPILRAPGLAPEPVQVFLVAGVPVTMDQLIVYAAVIVVLVVGAFVLLRTDIGLRVRAMVDSPAMTSLSGTNPRWVAVGVWATSAFLAGLAGVLSAPIIGLAPTDYTLLMAAAFAAVIAGRLCNLPMAMAVGFGMGILSSVLQFLLPPGSALTAAVVPSVPFAVAAIFLVYNLLRWGSVDENDGVGGALDLAITPQGAESLTGTATSAPPGGAARRRWSGAIPSGAVLVVVALLPLVLPNFWVGLLVAGIAYAVVFLSITLVSGEGGMIWLCQVTFAGIGAITSAQLASVYDWPVLLAVLAGGAIAAPVGLLIGVLTIRLGDLYVALVTLTFGLLMDHLVFSRDVFVNGGLGVPVDRPTFATDDQTMTYVGLAVFVVVAAAILNLRHSTTGLALGAVRTSPAGAKTVGVPVVRMKVVVTGLAAGVAGIGGALLAVVAGSALPENFLTLGGMVWLAVLVTAGFRSVAAALIAGVAFAVVPGLVLVNLSASWNQLPPILFGLGAIALAKNPEGFVLQNGRALRDMAMRSIGRSPAGHPRHPAMTTASRAAPVAEGPGPVRVATEGRRSVLTETGERP